MIDLSRFKAVIFDFDGVIVDSESLYTRAWLQLAQEMGVINSNICGGHVAGKIDRELVAEFFPSANHEYFLNRKWTIEAEMESRGLIQPVPGVVDLIERLRSTHILAICSSSHPDALRKRLKPTGLTDRFRVIRGRVEGLPHKPAPDLYLKTLTELDLHPREACAIEDSITGVAAAKAAGLFTIQFVQDGLPVAEDADAWITSFDEL